MRTTLGIAVVVIALIWAAVIVAVSMALGDVPQSSRVLSILGGGAAATIIVLGGIITRMKKSE